MKKVNTSWGNVADWYEDVVTKPGSYQQEVILPNLLRLLALKKGERIADVGCGTGFFSRHYAETGAVVTGLDIGKELIKVAKEHSPKTITYHVASAGKMNVLPDGCVDKATIVLALQNIENAQGAVSECARILVPGGKLYVVLNHPAFRIPQGSSWGWDDTTKVQYRRIDKYLSEGKVKIEMHPGSNPSEVTWSFHRSLQYYFKLFSKQGFMVGRLEEWVSHTRTPHGPRAAAENRARAEFPLFMCLELVKMA